MGYWGLVGDGSLGGMWVYGLLGVGGSLGVGGLL